MRVYLLQNRRGVLREVPLCACCLCDTSLRYEAPSRHSANLHLHTSFVRRVWTGGDEIAP